jgi:hypothetical protein
MIMAHVSDFMKVSEAEAEFDKEAFFEGRPYADGAMQLVKNQIAWLEYVPEDELGESERERIVGACRKLYAVLRPLNAKYID